MNSADYLTAPSRQRDQPSRQASQSSVVSHRFAVNSSAPRSLLVPGRGDPRYQPRNSDLEASTELSTIEPSHRRGFSSRQDNQRSAQDGMDFEDEFERVADDSPKSIKDGEEEEDDGASIRTQRTRLERRDLSMFDVAALIINKMIGTGIFTTPGLVLSLTANKKVSIILWLVGGIWSFLSILIYVEFGAAFPFNGGELIYLDEVLRRPDLYATVLFSAFFIVLANTTGNALQFAKHVLLAASPEIKRTEDLDQRLITLFAILVLTVVCLIHYFSRNSGLLLNLVFAAYKIILIVVFIIAGGIAYRNGTLGKNDWNDQPVANRDALAALIYIIYSYQGWENANYVGGELRIARSDLKWGAFMAVGIVTTLYTLVTMAYALACPFQDLVNQDLGIVTHFAPAVFNGSTGWVKVCIALSAFGNLIAVVYTSSKVKQQIARQCVIPFFRFFSKEDAQFETPVGALILHWTFALIWIIATPNTSGGYGFVIGIFIYGQVFVALCMGVAFFFLRRTYEGRGSRKTPENAASKVWKPVIFTKSDWFGYPVAVLFIGINMMVLVESARGSMLPHRWLWPIIFFGTMILASVYWAAIRMIARVSNKKGKKSPVEIRIVKIVRGGHTGTIDDEPALKQAKLEGNNRIVVYELHGKAKNLGDTINMWGYKLYKLVAR